MKSLGYNDFDVNENVNKYKVDYYHYLNKSSIDLINNVYHLDFILFCYEKI
jgi:hypothetical protein